MIFRPRYGRRTESDLIRQFRETGLDPPIRFQHGTLKRIIDLAVAPIVALIFAGGLAAGAPHPALLAGFLAVICLTYPASAIRHYRSEQHGALSLSENGIYVARHNLTFSWRDVGPASVYTIVTFRGPRIIHVMLRVRNASFYKRQLGWIGHWVFVKRTVRPSHRVKRFLDRLDPSFKTSHGIDVSERLDKLCQQFDNEQDTYIVLVMQTAGRLELCEDMVEIINDIVLERAAQTGTDPAARAGDQARA